MWSDTSDRTRRLLFNKISKCIDIITVQLAQPQVTIYIQTASVGDLNVGKSKKLKVVCKNVFANVDSIYTAQQGVEQHESAVNSRKFDLEAENTAKKILQEGMNDCITVSNLLNGQHIDED